MSCLSENTEDQRRQIDCVNPDIIKRLRNWLKGRAQGSESVDSLTHIVEDERVRRGSSTPTGSGRQCNQRVSVESTTCIH